MKKYILIILSFIYNFSYSSDKKATDFIAEGIEYLHANNYEKAIYSFNASQKLIDESYSYREQFLVYNNLGLIYYKMSEFKQATLYFEKAYKQAKNEKVKEDEMTVLNNLALLFIKTNNLDIAKKYFEQAYKIAENQYDLNKLAIYAVNLASVNYDLKEFDTCKMYLQKVSELNENIENKRIIINSKILSNSLLIHDGKTKLAISNLTELISICKNDNYIEELFNVYHSLVIAYFNENNFGKSLHYVDLCLSISNSADQKRDIFIEMSKIYFNQNKFDKAIQAKDSVIKYNEIIQKNINKESIENSRLNFELIKSAYEIKSQKEQLTKDRNYYIIIIIFFLVLCLLIIFIINKRHQNTKQKNLLINQNLLIKEYEFKKLLDSKESLINELENFQKNEKINNHLSNEIASDYEEKSKIRNQLFEKKLLLQITRNELLSDLLDEIINNKSDFNPEKTFEIIQKLRIHLKEDVNFVEDVYKNDFKKDHFIVSILKKHQNLNSNDLRLLTLIYLQTDTKEIAQLLFIAPETVRKRKERLKIKLEIEKTIDLTDYLNHFL